MTEATSAPAPPIAKDTLKPTAPAPTPAPQGNALKAPAQSAPTPAAPGRAEGDLISELEALKVRLHELELALASLAGPSLSQDAHDGLGFLLKWWKGFEARFAAARSKGISGGGA